MNDKAEDPAVALAREAIARAAIIQHGETAKAMKSRSLERTLGMAKNALKRAERIIARVLKIAPPPKPVACKKGCPWCCHIRLTMSPPEALLILEHIRKTFDKAGIDALRRKVANIDGFTRGLDGEARARLRLPCPLLKDDSCSVHQVRPLSCQAVASVDVAACRSAYDSRMQKAVPQYEFQHLAANAIGFGMYAGLSDGGFAIEDVELNAALAIGLDNPDIGKEWLDGKPVFAPATTVKKTPAP